jgi:hypothetical protein
MGIRTWFKLDFLIRIIRPRNSKGNRPCSGDGSEIRLGDPCIPVIHKLGMRSIIVLKLTKAARCMGYWQIDTSVDINLRELVNNGIVTSVIKERRSDPRLDGNNLVLPGKKSTWRLSHLKNKPTTQVYTPDLGRTKWEPQSRSTLCDCGVGNLCRFRSAKFVGPGTMDLVDRAGRLQLGEDKRGYGQERQCNLGECNHCVGKKIKPKE